MCIWLRLGADIVSAAALEARVELLSSDHDTQVDRLRWALRGLLNENNLLRSMLGNLAGFIGNDMLGGPLQKAGMDRDALEDLINTRSEKSTYTRVSVRDHGPC